MARTLRNDSPYTAYRSSKGRKAVQVRVNRRTRHNAKQALVQGLEIDVVRNSVTWDLI